MDEHDAKHVAAFFDLDGTLLEKPSLERRFWKALHGGGQIPLRNYAVWVWEMARLLPLGVTRALQTNKKYLRGVNLAAALHEERGRENAGRPVFLADGIECVLAHARRGERIVLLSGTLEPLAVHAAAGLKEELRVRGCEAAVHVCATQLEEVRGRWSGRISGEAMFGEAKAQAVHQLAETWNLELAQCAAYGDSAQDRWLLASVGHAFAVNPSRGLRRVARLHGWPVLRWVNERCVDVMATEGYPAIRDGESPGPQIAPACKGELA